MDLSMDLSSMDLKTVTALVIALTFPAITGSLPAQDADKLFEKPLRLQDAQGDINVEIGHAAPFVADIDQDGKADLLVGQFGNGRLRIYKNLGSTRSPRFDGFHWLMIEKKIASVPSG